MYLLPVIVLISFGRFLQVYHLEWHLHFLLINVLLRLLKYNPIDTTADYLHISFVSLHTTQKLWLFFNHRWSSYIIGWSLVWVFFMQLKIKNPLMRNTRYIFSRILIPIIFILFRIEMSFCGVTGSRNRLPQNCSNRFARWSSLASEIFEKITINPCRWLTIKLAFSFLNGNCHELDGRPAEKLWSVLESCALTTYRILRDPRGEYINSWRATYMCNFVCRIVIHPPPWGCTERLRLGAWSYDEGDLFRWRISSETAALGPVKLDIRSGIFAFWCKCNVKSRFLASTVSRVIVKNKKIFV